MLSKFYTALIVIDVLLVLGVISESDRVRHRNITLAFIVVIILTAILTLLEQGGA